MIILTDLDGTLTDKAGVISSGNFKVLRSMKALGVPCLLSTGRPSRVLGLPREQFELFDEIYTCNGAELTCWRGTEVIEPVDRNVLDLITSSAFRESMPGSFAVEFGSHFGYEDGYAYWPATDKNAKAAVGDLSVLCATTMPVAKILFKTSRATDPDVITDWFQARLGSGSYVTHSNLPGALGPIEIMSCRANKGAGAREFLRKHQTSGEVVVAFGDQLNDLPLLALGTFSFAIGASHPALTALYPNIPNQDQLAVSEVLLSGLRKGWMT